MFDIPKQAITNSVKYEWLKEGGIWIVSEHPLVCIWYDKKNDDITVTAHGDGEGAFRSLLRKEESITLIENKLVSTTIYGKDLIEVIDMLYDMSAGEYFIGWKPIDIFWYNDGAVCYLFNKDYYRLYKIWLGLDSDKALAIDKDKYYDLYLVN